MSAYGKLTAYLRGLTADGEGFRDGATVVTLGTLRALLHREFLSFGLEGGESIVA